VTIPGHRQLRESRQCGRLRSHVLAGMPDTVMGLELPVYVLVVRGCHLHPSHVLIFFLTAIVNK